MNFKPNYKLDLQMFAEDDPEKKDPKEESEDKDLDAIKALKELKANTVSKKEFEAVKKRNKELLEIVMNGEDPKKNLPEKKRASIEELRAELYGDKRHPMTNLEYWKKTLDLRDQLLEAGQDDPMVPHGKKVRANAQDYASAERVAEYMAELVKAANDDPVAFNGLLDKAGLGGNSRLRY